MAGEATIGALRVVLGADTAKFEDALNGAERSLARFAKQIGTIAAGIGLERAIEKTFAAISGSLKDAVKHADDMGKLAQKVGLGVEQLTALSFAAELSDVSMESLSTGLGKLSRNMAEAVGGNQKLIAQFNQLGIGITNADGSLRSVGDVLIDIADKFQNSADGAGKVSAAMALLGKGGRDLIPLLNEGGGSIRNMMEIAQRMGLVIRTDTAVAADKLGDNLQIMKLAAQGVANTVAAAFVPALAKMSQGYADAATKGTLVADVSTTIVEKLITFAKVAAQLIAFIVEMDTALYSLGKTARAAVSHDVPEMQSQWDLFKKTIAGMPEVMQNTADSVDRTLRVTLTGGIRAAKGEIQAPPDMSGWEGAARRLVQIYEQMFSDTRTLAEKFQMETDLINAAAAAGGVFTADLIARAHEKAAERVGATWKQAAPTIVGAFGEIAQSFAKENKSMAKAAQILGAAQALISTFVAQAEALKLPFPANLAAAALIAAKGFALVAAIRSQPIGMAQGGSFKVPGGVSGVDNTFVPLMLASGEQVDVTPSGGRGERATTVNITLQGDTVSRNAVRELFDTLNAGIRDGYRIKMA